MLSNAIESFPVLSQAKLNLSNPLKIIESGAKALKFSNYGWLLTVPLIILNLVIFPFVGFDVLTVLGMAASLMFGAILLVIDIAGYTILGIGLLKSRNSRNSSMKAGLAFISWAVFSVLWRLIVCISLLSSQTIDEDTKYILFDLIQWSYLAGSLALLVAAFFLVRTFDGTLPFIVYSCINILAAYFTGPVFIFTTDQTYVFIGTLILMIIVFKLLVVPSLGIASFNGLIESVRVIRESEEVQSTGHMQEVKTAYIDVKIKKTHIESFEGFKGRTITEQKKVKHAVIECPKCKYHYPVNSIHVNCLYCGEIIKEGKKLSLGK